MTISGTPGTPHSGGSNRVEGLNKTSKTEASGAPSNSGSSRVEVSDSARQMAELSKLVREAPDTREALVSDIQQRIEAGTYEVNLDALAEKLSDVL